MNETPNPNSLAQERVYATVQVNERNNSPITLGRLRHALGFAGYGEDMIGSTLWNLIDKDMIKLGPKWTVRTKTIIERRIAYQHEMARQVRKRDELEQEAEYEGPSFSIFQL